MIQETVNIHNIYLIYFRTGNVLFPKEWEIYIKDIPSLKDMRVFLEKHAHTIIE